jgi:hypothetical protein
MILQETHASGARTWACETCRRTIVVSVAEEGFRQIVLEEGDAGAVHSPVSYRGLQRGSVQAANEADAALDLSVWALAINDLDFDGPPEGEGAELDR